MKDINGLNCIHIAGTKGKGSTAAWIECMLRMHGKRSGFPTTTGLYTSPELVYMEDRIRINSRPLDREIFAGYVLDIDERLQTSASEQCRQPRFLQFLNIIAIHAFLKAGVNAAIFECHAGGIFDSTNVIEKPIVTAITPIGLDHIAQLGPSIERIAWHKAGIMKSGVRVYSVPQQPNVALVLQNQSVLRAAPLQFVDVTSDTGMDPPWTEAQKSNFFLAKAVSSSFLSHMSLGITSLSGDDVSAAIQGYSWPGRFQKVRDGGITWYLDGAHNDMSLRECCEWFARDTRLRREARTILVFGHVSEHRDHVALLEALIAHLGDFDRGFHDVIFTLPSKSRSADPHFLQDLKDVWERHHIGGGIHMVDDTVQALELARSIAIQHRHAHVLITGSLYLIGDALRWLKHHKLWS